MDSDSDRFVQEVQRYMRRRGVFAAAQALRRQGLSLVAAILLLAREGEKPRNQSHCGARKDLNAPAFARNVPTAATARRAG